MDKEYYAEKTAVVEMQMELAKRGFMEFLPDSCEALTETENYDSAVELLQILIDRMAAVKDLNDTLAYNRAELEKARREEAI